MQIKDFTIYQGSTFSETITLYAQATINYQGSWSQYYSYKVNDVIVHNNVVYKCILAHSNQEPPNGTYWGSLTPIDLSSSTFAGKIRFDDEEEAEIASFTFAYVTDGTDGKFTMSLTAAQTAAFKFDEAFYDVEVTTGATVTKYLGGRLLLSKEYTK